MNALRAAASTLLALSLLVGAGGAAQAQEPAPPAPGGGAAQAAPPAPGGERAAEEARDRPRLRGGFSLEGGVIMLPSNPVGGAFSLAGRVGGQFNRYFSIYYQNTPIVGASVARDMSMQSGTVVFADYNSLLLDVTLLDFIDIGAGPSVDYIALARGSLMLNGLASSASTSTGTGIAAGGHGRFAINIGGGKGPRRSGFSIGVDAHPMFLSTGKALSLTTGIGAEWF